LCAVAVRLKTWSCDVIRRALLKLSGEAFAPIGSRGVSTDSLKMIAAEIKSGHEVGAQLAVVVGGGNIVRGSELDSSVINRPSADYMGMLATVINTVALQDVLESLGVPTELLSSLQVDGVTEPFARRRGNTAMEEGRVLILAGGTGKPFVTTDTASVQAALELNCNVVLKATKVDGVYERDPVKDPSARRFAQLSYADVLDGHETIRVMDMTAISLCREHDLPVVIFDLRKSGNIAHALRGDAIGTRIGAHETQLG
jgi:uridylate kinase